MDNFEQKIAEATDAVKTENNESEAVTDLGKFKDVKALLKAYENLEAEFTRRSQRLKDLESSQAKEAPAVEAVTAPAPSQAPTPSDRTAFLDDAVKDEEVRKRIISGYLTSLKGGKSVPLMTGGVQTVTERKKLSSVREASRLAKNFLNQS